MISLHSNILWLLILPFLKFQPIGFNSYHTNLKTKSIKWAVQKSSTICIKGSTNLTDFGCDIIGYYQTDTIFCSEENLTNRQVTLNGDLQLDIQKFDCHNKMLTGDLRKTLKAAIYPTLVISFLSLERAPVIHQNKDFLRGWVEIELAGNKRKFEVCYSFVKTGDSYIQLNGNRSFSFADFKLTPPKKFCGLVKVNDRFNVDFNLLLHPVD